MYIVEVKGDSSALKKTQEDLRDLTRLSVSMTTLGR